MEQTEIMFYSLTKNNSVTAYSHLFILLITNYPAKQMGSKQGYQLVENGTLESFQAGLQAHGMQCGWNPTWTCPCGK